MITGDRIKHVRELRGWTQAEMAALVDSTQATIAYLEKGSREPPQDLLERVALRTGFPTAFFKRPPVEDFPEGSFLYAPQRGITGREKAQARRYGASFLEIVFALERRMEARPLRIPRQQGDPVQAARTARASMMLAPDRPVPHVLRALERAGVWVAAIPVGLKEKHEAFSAWIASDTDVPFIGILQRLPGDRLRMNLARELGHLVLHTAAEGPPKTLEDEAYLFAQEFLMPEVCMRDEMQPPLTLTKLAPLKLHWGVSLQALIRRAKTLEILTPRQYTHLMMQISVRGWHSDEPLSDAIPVERPRNWRKMAEVVYGEPLDYGHIATDLSGLGYSALFIRELLDAHATKADDAEAQQQIEARGRILSFPEFDTQAQVRGS